MAVNFTLNDWRMHAMMHEILVVNDEDFKRGEISGIALANGFRCDYARSAPEAWSKLTSGKSNYEMMITDNSMIARDGIETDGYDYSTAEGLELLDARDRMSGNEGLQLIRRVRQHPQLKDLEIMMYSGSGVREQAEAFGAKYMGIELYVLNDILRERSELYREAAQNPKEAKKGFFDFLKR